MEAGTLLLVAVERENNLLWKLALANRVESEGEKAY